jgi:hypothetical protein
MTMKLIGIGKAASPSVGAVETDPRKPTSEEDQVGDPIPARFTRPMRPPLP